MASNNSGKKLIGNQLVEKGVITTEQLREALHVQSRTGELLGQIMVNLGMISENSILQLPGFQKISLKTGIDPQLLKGIPEQMIRLHKIIPLRIEGSRLIVAMSDPMNVVAMDDLRLVTGLEIEPVKADEKEIDAVIQKYFGALSIGRAFQEFDMELETVRPEAKPEEEIVDEAPVIRLVNSLLGQAIEENASDIHIEPGEYGLRIRNRIDGFLHELMNLPARMTSAVISRIKIMCNMDIAEKRIPQDGRIQVKFGHREFDLRVSSLPTVFGEKIVIRLLDKGSVKNFSVERLGFSDKNLDLFENFLKSSYGMILITGPTGSGKTTTLYTALNALNSIDKNIITVEDPVEYTLEGINQTQLNVKAGMTFAKSLRSILRQDPDIIMVGEIRDKETAEIAVRAANTGHLVLSTLHTNDAPGAITRLIDMGIEPFLAASSVLGVVAQRLVRRICPACKEAYQLEDDSPERFFAGIQPGEKVTLHTGKGCEQCNHTGYKGRIPIHEVLDVSRAIRFLILKRASEDEIRLTASTKGLFSLKEDGIKKALKGLTTVSEIMRATTHASDTEPKDDKNSPIQEGGFNLKDDFDLSLKERMHPRISEGIV